LLNTAINIIGPNNIAILYLSAIEGVTDEFRKTKIRGGGIKSQPYKVLDTYREIMHLAEYRKFISRDIDTLCAQIYPRSPN
jgi:hypothetical protein